MPDVNIKGINKIHLLKEMWIKSLETNKYNNIFGLTAALQSNSEFDEKLAKETLNRSTYVDYFQGAMIKTDFKGDTIDSYLYDRDIGSGALQRIVDDIKKPKIIIL